jgi:alkylation response protein AidB-like acyl-CoA dehydrogenase
MTTSETTDWTQLGHRIGTEIEGAAPDHDRSGELNRDAFERLKAAGLTTALVPKEFGGGGATHREIGDMLRALGSHDPSTAVTLAMHTHLVAAQVWRHNHNMNAEPFFRRVVDDHAIAISTGASDWIPSNGTAEPVDGGFRVSARKAPASECS